MRNETFTPASDPLYTHARCTHTASTYPPTHIHPNTPLDHINVYARRWRGARGDRNTSKIVKPRETGHARGGVFPFPTRGRRVDSVRPIYGRLKIRYAPQFVLIALIKTNLPRSYSIIITVTRITTWYIYRERVNAKRRSTSPGQWLWVGGFPTNIIFPNPDG